MTSDVQIDVAKAKMRKITAARNNISSLSIRAQTNRNADAHVDKIPQVPGHLRRSNGNMFLLFIASPRCLGLSFLQRKESMQLRSQWSSCPVAAVLLQVKLLLWYCNISSAFLHVFLLPCKTSWTCLCEASSSFEFPLAAVGNLRHKKIYG